MYLLFIKVGLDDTRVAIVSFGNAPYTRKHIDLDDCRNKDCLLEVLWSIDSPVSYLRLTYCNKSFDTWH